MRQRTRYRTVPANFIWSKTNENGTYYAPSPCLNFVEAEGITDIPNNAFNFNPVSHVKVLQIPGTPQTFAHSSLMPYPHTRAVAYAGNRLPQEWNSESSLHPRLVVDDLGSKVGLIPEEDAGQFTRDALDKVFNQVPEVLSIANFILELRELPDLLPKLQGWLTGPNAFLSWNFGWVPLIGDLKNALTLVAHVNKRLAHLKKVNQRLVTFSHQKKFVLVDDPSPIGFVADEQSIYSNNWPARFHTKEHYTEVTARIHLGVYHDLNLRGVDTFIAAMCAALGLNNPAKIVWNAIPFSFVVDWLIAISDFLATTTNVQPFEGPVTIKWSSCSFKSKSFFTHYTPVSKNEFGFGEMGAVAETQVHSYHRRSGVPQGTIKIDGLTPFQQQLAVALLASSGAWQPSTRRRRKSRR